jgi:large subunit ribosomal protein L6
MSRIGKSIITMPAGVTVKVTEGNVVNVKGPKGELKETLNDGITITEDAGVITVNRASDSISHRALHGLSRALINNMVVGVSTGYTKELELVGVGYKAVNIANQLDLALGYSHNIIFEIPKELKLTTITEKGANPRVILEGIDKQLIGAVAAKIRSLRKPEPYKGKGVRYKGEEVRRKAGKSAGK